jgi:hypothetical protein
MTNLVQNGNFIDGFPGYWSGDVIDDGDATIVTNPYQAAEINTPNGYEEMYYDLGLNTEIGKSYTLSFDLANNVKSVSYFAAHISTNTFLAVNSDAEPMFPLQTFGPYQFTATSTITNLWFDIYKPAGSFYLTNITVFEVVDPPTPICFKEDTKISCLQDNNETDIFIQNLKSGDLVKTYKHGYLPVNVVGRNICYNPKNAQRLKSRLFKLKKEKYPSLKEDLIVTGCHSILESTISQSKGEELMEVNKRIYTTDELIRLPAYLDDRSDPYLDEYGDINVYHVALGNDESRNYGIYANGLLVESCFIPRIKNEMTVL